MIPRICQAMEDGEICGGKYFAKDMCRTHYYRDYNQKNRPRPAFPNPTCSVIENGMACGRKHMARGMCRIHYKRWSKWGDPLISRPRGGQYGRGMNRWHKTDVTCAGAHARVRSVWGSAIQYPCIECGKQAKDWAYDGTDPTQKYGPSTSRKDSEYWTYYSQYPEFYMPLCVKCHRSRDGKVAKSQLEEIRHLMHETGFSVGEICDLVSGTVR